jgi:hypothetical protein
VHERSDRQGPCGRQGPCDRQGPCGEAPGYTLKGAGTDSMSSRSLAGRQICSAIWRFAGLNTSTHDGGWQDALPAFTHYLQVSYIPAQYKTTRGSMVEASSWSCKIGDQGSEGLRGGRKSYARANQISTLMQHQLSNITTPTTNEELVIQLLAEVHAHACQLCKLHHLKDAMHQCLVENIAARPICQVPRARSSK